MAAGQFMAAKIGGNEYPMSNKECPISKLAPILATHVECFEKSVYLDIGHSLLVIGYSHGQCARLSTFAHVLTTLTVKQPNL